MVTSEYAWYSSPERVLCMPENVSVRFGLCHVAPWLRWKANLVFTWGGGVAYSLLLIDEGPTVYR